MGSEPARGKEILAKFSYYVYKWSGRKVEEKPRGKRAEMVRTKDFNQSWFKQ